LRHLGVGDPNKSILDRAYDAGYGGTVLSGFSAFDSKGQVSADVLFQRLLSNVNNTAAFLSDDAAYIGVGLAFLAEGISSEYRLRIILGKEISGVPADGTTGQENATGRGLLDLTLLREIRAGAWSGDSIKGFVRDPNLVVLTVAEEKAFAAALGTFLRKNAAIRTSVGKGVNLRLPPRVTRFVESFVVKGRIPPGIRFDERTKRFRGVARGSGSFTVVLTGDLTGPVKGSEKLQPIRIRFTIGE